MGSKFFAAISNPPYQGEASGASTYMSQVYPLFMDTMYDLADKSEVNTPARYLFDAGGTPKKWNEERLTDPHFKVLKYSADNREVFPNVDIKGGVAVSYRDRNQDFGCVQVFIPDKRLRNIWKKVVTYPTFSGIDHIAYSRGSYLLSENGKSEAGLPLSRRQILATNIFEVAPSLFKQTKSEVDEEACGIVGLLHGKRRRLWTKSRNISGPNNYRKWKVFVPKANGCGALGERIATPLIGHTETFISIGCFDTKEEAAACLKYIKSKFARCLLGVKKITQDCTPQKWIYVPIQDFTTGSDIDWTQGVAEIDHQLYAKYGLEDEEVSFIEEKVKAME